MYSRSRPWAPCALALILAACGGGSSSTQSPADSGAPTPGTSTPASLDPVADTPMAIDYGAFGTDAARNVLAAGARHASVVRAAVTAAATPPTFGSVTQSASGQAAGATTDGRSFAVTIPGHTDSGTLTLDTATDAVWRETSQGSIFSASDTIHDATLLRTAGDTTTLVRPTGLWVGSDPSDYLVLGYWLHLDGDLSAQGTVTAAAAGAFIDGPGFRSGDRPTMPVGGSARYTGRSTGYYTLEYGAAGTRAGRTEGGQYFADVALTADFAAGTIQGCIGCQRDDGAATGAYDGWRVEGLYVDPATGLQETADYDPGRGYGGAPESAPGRFTIRLGATAFASPTDHSRARASRWRTRTRTPSRSRPATGAGGSRASWRAPATPVPSPAPWARRAPPRTARRSRSSAASSRRPSDARPLGHTGHRSGGGADPADRDSARGPGGPADGCGLDGRDRKRIAAAIAPALPDPPSGDTVLRGLDFVRWPELPAVLLLECLIDHAYPELGSGRPHAGDWATVRVAGGADVRRQPPATLPAECAELRAAQVRASLLDPVRGHLDLWFFPVLRDGDVELPKDADDPSEVQLDWTFRQGLRASGGGRRQRRRGGALARWPVRIGGAMPERRGFGYRPEAGGPDGGFAGARFVVRRGTVRRGPLAEPGAAMSIPGLPMTPGLAMFRGRVSSA